MIEQGERPLGSGVPDRFAAVLADLEGQGLRRRRRTVRRLSHETAEIELDGRPCVDFCSNDYLGLAAHPRVTAAFVDAAREHGVGARASHLITGHQGEHDALEEALAAFTGRERAILFSTGYMANLGLATALVGKGGAVLGDALNHASLIDAGRIARATLGYYPHGDAGALELALKESAPGSALVLTDGVFSMDGDLAPLPEIAATCSRHGAFLAVDDAHGLGVREVPALVGTLGKAFGCFGAFVAGDAGLIETLVQRARTYIYTTALPVAVASAARAALAVSVSESWRRARVLALARRFRLLASEARLPLADSTTPIQPILLGTADAAVEASAKLLERGYYVAAIRPPTVPAGTSRLRLALSAAHRDADLEGLVAALVDCVPRA